MTDLREIVSVFHGEEFLELVIDDIGTTSNLLARLVLTTLHVTQPHSRTARNRELYRELNRPSTACQY